jgi:hypothetical protein
LVNLQRIEDIAEDNQTPQATVQSLVVGVLDQSRKSNLQNLFFDKDRKETVNSEHECLIGGTCGYEFVCHAGMDDSRLTRCARLLAISGQNQGNNPYRLEQEYSLGRLRFKSICQPLCSRHDRKEDGIQDACPATLAAS